MFRLVKPSAEIEAYYPNMLQVIERAGRTCYKSEDKITDESAEEFIRKVLKRGHESVIEHGAITVRIICDRGVTHELVRHRLAAYSQESTRYCDYTSSKWQVFKEAAFTGPAVQFVIPPWVEQEIREGLYSQAVDEGGMTVFERQGGGVLENGKISVADWLWLISIAQSAQRYQSLRKAGWSPQQARSVLPNSLKTEIVATCNPREWRHIFRLRTSAAAHPQMQEVMKPLLDEFISRWPPLFEDLK